MPRHPEPRRILVYEIGLLVFFGMAYLILRNSGEPNAFIYCALVFLLLQPFIIIPSVVSMRGKRNK